MTALLNAMSMTTRTVPSYVELCLVSSLKKVIRKPNRAYRLLTTDSAAFLDMAERSSLHFLARYSFSHACLA
jgi:hypothetical protein